MCSMGRWGSSLVGVARQRNQSVGPGSMFAVGQAWPEPLGSFQETAARKRGIPQRRRRWDVPHVWGRAPASSTGRLPLPLMVIRRRAGRRAGRRSSEDRVVLPHQPFTPWGRGAVLSAAHAPQLPRRRCVPSDDRTCAHVHRTDSAEPEGQAHNCHLAQEDRMYACACASGGRCSWGPDRRAHTSVRVPVRAQEPRVGP